MNEKRIKKRYIQFEKLQANSKDGFIDSNGFNHTKAHLARLQFVEDKVEEEKNRIIKILEKTKGIDKKILEGIVINIEK